MEGLSIQARNIILELFQWGYDSQQIKYAMEDGEYLKNEGIPQEISEEIHFFLCNNCESILK